MKVPATPRRAGATCIKNLARLATDKHEQTYQPVPHLCLCVDLLSIFFLFIAFVFYFTSFCLQDWAMLRGQFRYGRVHPPGRLTGQPEYPARKRLSTTAVLNHDPLCLPHGGN